ncbi:LamG domain-containing protein [Candidatus Gracilibacteria bacterium]|nr:LamG domain-containing protein [Candidatus Gracilibacteria bacterium]
MSQETLRSATSMGDVSSNGYHGTITAGASEGFVTDQHGQANKAYDFDRADTKIETSLTSNADFQNGFTVSAWINPDSIGENNYGRIVDKSNSASAGDGLSFRASDTNELSFAINIIGDIDAESGDNSITLNQWQQVLVTVTESGGDGLVNFYIDGIHSGDTDQNAGVLSDITTSNPLTIGNRSTATDRTFDGQISDVRIYNRVLSTDEISLLYESYNPKTAIGSLEKGLVGHWELGQDDEGWTDNIVTNSGASNTTDWTDTNEDGLADGWTERQNSATGTPSIVTGNGFTGNAQRAYIDTVSAGNYQLYINSGAVQNHSYLLSLKYRQSHAGSTLYVWDGSWSTLKTLSQNTGDAITSKTSITWNSADPTLYIGFNISAIDVGDWFEIDEVSLQPLSTQDISANNNHGELYQDATVYTTDRKGQSNKAMEFNGSSDYIDVGDTSQTIKSVSFWIEADSTSEDILDLDGGTHTVEVGAGTLTATGFDTPTLYVNGSAGATLTADTWYHVVITTATGIDTNDFDIGRIAASYFDGNLADVRLYDRVLSTAEITELYESYDRKLKTGSLNKGLIAYYPLKTKYYNPATERLDDISAYSNHGTLTPGTGSVTADYTTFDGTSSFIDIPQDLDTLFGTDDFSVSTWVKLPASVASLEGIFGKYVDSASTGLWFRTSTDNKIYARIKATGTPSGYVEKESSVAYTDTLWHHVVFTADRSANGELFIDGVSNGTVNISNHAGLLGSDSFWIGKSLSSGQYLNGSISDIRIYNRVLSTDEISLLYKMGY